MVYFSRLRCLGYFYIGDEKFGFFELPGKNNKYLFPRFFSPDLSLGDFEVSEYLFKYFLKNVLNGK